VQHDSSEMMAMRAAGVAEWQTLRT
jgi:lipopolysaccharide export LptBFGC system permease protein LptF